MIRKLFLCLALLSATAGMAATSGFMLGSNYTEWSDPNATQIATDNSGALYILSTIPGPSLSYLSVASYVTKVSADGKTIVWQDQLGFVADTMAVDPTGGVYVVPAWWFGDQNVYVAKLSADGTGIAWQTAVGVYLMPTPTYLPGEGDLPMLALTADSQGRAYVAVNDEENFEFPTPGSAIIRLNAAGSAVEFITQLPDMLWPGSIVVDGSGAMFVANTANLLRVEPDGSIGFSTHVPGIGGPSIVGVDANGNAWLYGAQSIVGYEVTWSGAILSHFDSTGNLTFSATLAGGAYPTLGVDAAGNAYIIGSSGDLFSGNVLLPTTNSVGTCGSDLLQVYGPDGSLLQNTYIPGYNSREMVPLLAATANSTVFVVDVAGAAFVPTQAGPFPAGTSTGNLLWGLSAGTNVQTLPLSCIGNSASYRIGAIAPGEMVTLFGKGLGPEQGIQTTASLQTAFPTEAGNVEVTFDGNPAPLLWVQDAQINAVAPWSLTPGQTTQVCVFYNNVQTNCLTSAVVQAVPGVFTVDGGYAAALNQDGTVNSANNPAPVGSIVAIFATGMGPITPPQADGTLVGLPLPSNVLAAEVYTCFVISLSYGPTMGPWAALDTPYAGPAPYLVAGASQINFQVPALNNQGGPNATCLSTPSTAYFLFAVFIANP